MKRLYLLCFTFLLSIPTASAEKWLAPEFIENAFVEIALRNEYTEGSAQLRKWVEPIQFTVQYHQIHNDPNLNALINAQFADLSEITGHRITQATSNEANFRIEIIKDDEYSQYIQHSVPKKFQNAVQKSHCLTQLKYGPSSQIHQATVVIPADHAYSNGLIVACVVEELTQAMGLPNDSDWVYPSIANDQSVVELLTGLDYIFLKLLYSSALKPGMEEPEVRQKIKKLLKAMHAKGQLKRAFQRVKETKMYRLTNG